MKNALAELHNPHLVKRFDAARPPSMSWDAELGFAQQLLRANDYLMGIANNNPTSLVHAMANVAAIGLSLNPAEGLAYLVPRKGKVCLDPSYKGLVKLATDSGGILFVQAHCFYANDTWENRGTEREPLHDRDDFAPLEERGEFRGVYCVAKTRDGSYLVTTMTAEEIYKIRDKSSEAHKGGRGSPWDDWATEMAKKTVVRRASKLWTRSLDPAETQRMYAAIDISNENEGLELVKSNPVGAGQYSDEQKGFFDQMIGKGDAEAMIIFQKSTTEIDFQALYHSFEDGSKGRNQAVVDGLIREGSAMVTDFAQLVNDFTADGGDLESVVLEMGDLFDLVKDQVGNEGALAMAEVVAHS